MKWFAKKIVDGGAGVDNKNYRLKSTCYLSEIFKCLHVFPKLFPNEPVLKNRSSGAILIEFAVCMPILIILLFYINDLVKIKRLYSQVEFVGQQMANILQNISKCQPITNSFLKRAFALAWLSVYPGTSMCWENNGTQLIHRPYTIVYYVKGLPNGKASCIWRKNIYTDSSTATNPDKFPISSGTTAVGYSVVKFRTDVDPSSIYPSLKIENGEKKIIIDNMQYWTTSFKSNDGKTANSAREVFKCYLLDPKKTTNAAFMFSNKVVIFTPKPGLFDETPPS